MTLNDEVRRLRETLKDMQKAIDGLRTMAEEHRSMLDRHEEQVNGQRGLSTAIGHLSDELKALGDRITVEVASMRRAAYWVAGVILVAAITFAFSTLKYFA